MLKNKKLNFKNDKVKINTIPCFFQLNIWSFLLFMERIVLYTTSMDTPSRKWSKIFSGYFNFQGIMMQLPLDNKENSFNWIEFWAMCWNVQRLLTTLSQSALICVLFHNGSRFCENSFPLKLALFLSMPATFSQMKMKNLFDLIPPSCCSAVVTPFSYAIAAI